MFPGVIGNVQHVVSCPSSKKSIVQHLDHTKAPGDLGATLKHLKRNSSLLAEKQQNICKISLCFKLCAFLAATWWCLGTFTFQHSLQGNFFVLHKDTLPEGSLHPGTPEHNMGGIFASRESREVHVRWNHFAIVVSKLKCPQSTYTDRSR